MSSNKFRLWKDNKTNDYKYADRIINQFFFVSGTKILIHRYDGTYDDKGNPVDGVKVQDLLFMETRDRRYSQDVFEIMTIYEMSDDDFELSQFGFMESNTLYMDFHLNEMVDRIGRKLSSGDVLEVLHLRDDLLEGQEGAINTFYVVEDARRPVTGFNNNWLPHMWRVRVKKMLDSTQFTDITDNMENGDLISILGNLEEANQQVLDEAEENVPYNEATLDYVYDSRFDGAIIPPDDLDISNVHSGIIFPEDAEDGEYFIREDYHPHQLFRYDEENQKWSIVDLTVKNWTGPHEYTESFVENEEENCVNGEKRKEHSYITDPLGLKDDDE